MLSAPAKKVSVLVVGFKPNNQQKLEREVGKKVKLKFQPFQDGPKQRPFQQADYVVVMTNFIGHNIQERLFNDFSRQQVRLVRGGVPVAVEAIQEIANKA